MQWTRLLRLRLLLLLHTRDNTLNWLEEFFVIEPKEKKTKKKKDRDRNGREEGLRFFLLLKG